jgi:uncharacterized protein YneF (UPF0154 family)
MNIDLNMGSKGSFQFLETNVNQTTGCVNFNCNNNGVCVDQFCECLAGYFLDQNSNFSNCDVSISGTFFDVIRWSTAILHLFVAIISIGTFALVYRGRRNLYPVALYTKLWCFGTCAAASTVSLIRWSIDPFSLQKVMPFYIDTLLGNSAPPLLYSSYFGILYHWIAFTQLALHSLAKANMWKKMGRYQGQVTVEQVAERIDIIERTRIPLIIFLTCYFIVVVAGSVLDFFFPQFRLVYVLRILQLGLLVGIFVGFFVYRRRLQKILPEERKPLIDEETKVIFIVALLNIVPWFIFGPVAAVFSRNNPVNFVIVQAAGNYLFVFEEFVVYWVQVRKWPLLQFSKNRTHTSTQHSQNEVKSENQQEFSQNFELPPNSAI